MGWSTDGFSYSQSQIGSTAYNAGCGNGYFWIHTGSPYMFIKGYINDGGAYSFTFYKPNSSHFGYYLKIYACGRLIFDLTASDLDNKSCSQTVSGTFSESEYNTNRTLHADCQANEDCVASLSMDGVTYYKAPSNISLSISSITAKTATLSSSWTKGSNGGNSATIYATTYNATNTAIADIQKNNSGSVTINNGSTATINNLVPNTTYYFTVYYNDQSGRPDGSIRKTVYTVTYKVWATDIVTTTKTISFKLGTNRSVVTIIYNVGGVLKEINTNNYTTETIKLTNLQPGTAYRILFKVKGIDDTLDEVTINTKTAVSGASISAVATGTTITVTPTWNTNGSTGCKSYILCDDKLKTQTTSGSSVMFTNLSNGNYYTISMYVTDDENNKSTASDLYIETYEVSFYSIDSSTKAIQFSEYISGGANTSKQLMYKISGGNASNSSTYYNNKVTQSNLNHNTTYTITGWISGMVDEYGDLDTVTSITINTKKLTVECTSHKQHQHRIISNWQAKANGNNYNVDNLIGDYISFKLSHCSNSGYKHEDDNTNKFTYATPTNNGSISGDYSLDKTLISSGLDYWAWYRITCAVTDGHNIVTSILDTNTTFPYSLIFIDGEYKKVMPYVYTDGKWINSTSYIYDASWKESGKDA